MFKYFLPSGDFFNMVKEPLIIKSIDISIFVPLNIFVKRHDALVEGKAKANSILFDVEELNKVVNGTNDWKNASDIEVKNAMRNVDKWKEEMKKIIETKREFMILVEKNNFRDDNVKKDRVEREVNDLKSKID